MASDDERFGFINTMFNYGIIQDSCCDNYKVLCPFHDDVNASMVVDLVGCRWYCFGCQQSGNAIGFIKRMEGCNDLEAYRKLIKIKSERKQTFREFKPPRKRSAKRRRIEAYDFFFGLRKVDWNDESNCEQNAVFEYLLDRGFSKKTLRLADARITHKKEYPVVFPMFDNGRFKGYVCRTTDKEIEKRRKYLYNRGFSRASTLVGNYQCSSGMIAVVEGYMDRLRMLQNGYKDVVAILGWKATTEQIEKLKKQGIRCVISALDNDQCGRDGTDFLSKFFDVTKWCYKKGIKDPGEMSKPAFDEMYKKTFDLFYSNK